jgi:hypothetical protein
VSERGSPFTTAGFHKMVARLGVAAKFQFAAHPHGPAATALPLPASDANYDPTMLEEERVALARAELQVIQARGRLSDQLAKVARKASSEAEQELGLVEAYLLIVERPRDFLLRCKDQRSDRR